MRAAQQHGRPELTVQERRVLVEWLLTDNKESVGKDFISPLAPSGPTFCASDGGTARSTALPPLKQLYLPERFKNGLIGIHDV